MPISTILHQTDISFTTNQVNYSDIEKLEGEFEEKRKEFSELKTGPESKRYQELRSELFRIDEEIDLILWG